MKRGVIRAVAVIAMLALFSSSFLLTGTARTRGVKRKAWLTGEREVPGPGDPNGVGRAVIFLKRKDRKICYRSLRWIRIASPTAAHIHKGRRGQVGPVKVTLFDGAIPSNITAVRGCVEDVRRRLIKKIARHPRRYYVNVHNRPYPDGAIRGQLRRPRRR